MNPYITFFIGVFVGGILGFLLGVLCSMSYKREPEVERRERIKREMGVEE
jgi:hypothetical protein